MAAAFGLPLGYKFHPRDEELVGYYLYNKVCGAPFRYEDIVLEVDLYGSTEARDIWNNNGGHNLERDEDLYLFTKLKPASTGKDSMGSRVARTIGSGTWHGENSGKKVKDPTTKETIGLWKRFNYRNTKYPQENGCWIMHEFSLDPKLLKLIKSSSSDRQDDDGEYVICRIRKNYDRKRKAEDRDRECEETTRQSNKIQRHLENIVEEVNIVHYTQQPQQEQTNYNINATSSSSVTNVDQPQYFYSEPQNSNVTPMSSEVFGVNVDHYYYQQQQEHISNGTDLPHYYYPQYYETQGQMTTSTVSSSSFGVVARPDDFVADASCLPDQLNSDARQEAYLRQNDVYYGTDLSQYHNSSMQEEPASSQLHYGMDQDQTAADFNNFDALNVDDIYALIDFEPLL